MWAGLINDDKPLNQVFICKSVSHLGYYYVTFYILLVGYWIAFGNKESNQLE